MVSELIKKYVYLIQILLDAGDRGLTLEEIRSRWNDRFGEDYPRRSFNNHRESVAEVFGIDIECRRSENRYYIPYGEEVINENDSLAWMVNTFTVNNLLSLGRERLSGRVQIENIPSGQVHLTTVLGAMTSSCRLRIVYKKYSSAEAETLHVSPYGLKEYQKRWYMVAWCSERDALRIYSLDRIMLLEPLADQFRLPEDFNMDELFYNSFGPYLPQEDSKPVTVRISTHERQARYFRDLPLHPSQIEEKQDDGESVFSFYLVPNEDLYMELLRFTGKIRILDPPEVREEVLNRIKQSI